MGKYVINGGNALIGEVCIQGSKNSSLAILLSCLLIDGGVKLNNVPEITDVAACIGLMRSLGCDVKYSENNSLCISTKNIGESALPSSLTSSFRASSYLIGALTSRFGKCELPKSGGCNIGTRPLNLHIEAMKSLGAVYDEECSTLYAPNGLKGGIINFPTKSVGATVNAILASVLAEGKTAIYNAAREPHIKDLCTFLRLCGARIEGDGGDIITVNGVEKLHGATYTIDNDMIEAGTFLIMGAATGGRVKCIGAPKEQLLSLTDFLSRVGVEIRSGENYIEASGNELSGTDIITAPYPLFPTDLQPQATCILGLAKGISTVTETVFENRFAYVKELKKCGLICSFNGSSLNIQGCSAYLPGNLYATDLRGGAALVTAALSANGISEIHGTEFIERGYSCFTEKLSSLGADIIRY